MPRTHEELREIFHSLGADEPDAWAGSEVRENIPQLARFLFLRGAWSFILKEDDATWPDDYIDTEEGGPNSGAGPALRRILKKGVDVRDLTNLIRIMQCELLFQVCYLLDDPFPAIEDVVERIPALKEVAWGVFELDDNEDPTRRIGGLHESVLEMDPTGREMRPRPESSE